MKKQMVVFCVLLIGAIAFCGLQEASAAMSSASYRMSPAALSGGGGGLSSASYDMNATVGQAGVIGVSENSDYAGGAGFWYMFYVDSLSGDVNGDGAVDLADVVLTLQVLNNNAVSTVFRTADIDQDERIGLPEALYIIQFISGAK